MNYIFTYKFNTWTNMSVKAIRVHRIYLDWLYLDSSGRGTLEPGPVPLSSLADDLPAQSDDAPLLHQWEVREQVVAVQLFSHVVVVVRSWNIQHAYNMLQTRCAYGSVSFMTQ